MESQPLVSIITVSYNSEKYIEDTIESVLKQTYPNIEYIVVDGQSIDSTLEIVKEYEPKFDGRMRWVSEKDEGIYDAMNKGIKMADGEIIGIINSDDWYEKHTVATIVGQFNTDPQLDLVHGEMALYDNREKLESIYGRKSDWFSFVDQSPFNHPTCFVKKGIYQKLGCFDTSFDTAADYDFMLKVHLDKEIKTKFLPKVLANFRMVGTTSEIMFPGRDIYRILRKHGFSPFIGIAGLCVRFVRVSMKYAIKKLHLGAVIDWYRKIVSHHRITKKN